ncbi:MAG TPA: 23S rRNA (adenine(2503)-C(2))-methyltransferase RlmN [Planctomycetota bacterium]|nr:23S rRNA (adenine(2503)-C(2))-methyltransferase RlmN [Planctomycetota bacterium]
MSVEESPRVPLLSLSAPELSALVERLGGRPFHAKILRAAVLQKGVLDFEAMTSLPKALRDGLAREVSLLSGKEVDRVVSRDRTTKLLLSFARNDGRDATVETVHIPPHDPTRGAGATLCVSTQVGCPVGCPFCASGKNGLIRNLEAHEIVEQYVRGRAIGELSRSVVMGIGEPLLNYANLSAALDVVHDEMGMGTRKVTVSTVGFPDRLRRIAPTKPRFQLAISLHTPDDEQRAILVPAMKDVPIEEILAAGDDWFEVTGREVTYEYVLLSGENDSEGHAERLAERLARRRCTVNLIPFNPVRGAPYSRPILAAVEHFQAALAERRVVSTVRWSRGVESDAACGQLRIKSLT